MWVIWLVLAALVVLLAGATWHRRLRAAAVPELPAPSGALQVVHPVVLAHGILGFERLELLGVGQDYFRGIARKLRAEGLRVHAARVPALGSVPARAHALADYLLELPYAKVNIIAHSMGGLDARYAISRLGLHTRVAALITIGTPHRGTPIADLGTRLPAAVARALIRRAGLRTEALDWLTCAAMERFNEEVPDIDGVIYGSVIARVGPGLLGCNPLLRPSHTLLTALAGPSDGLVPVSSQLWGEHLGEIHADHWAQVGWGLRSPFDAAALYAELLGRLRRRGL